MTEREQAYLLAEKLLNVPNCDPDDGLRMLSRQLLRCKERLERVEAICHKYTEYADGRPLAYSSIGAMDCKLISEIVKGAS